MQKVKDFILPVTILGLSIGGTLTQNNIALYAMVFLVIVSVILVITKRTKEWVHPYLIFSIGLSLVYMTTLFTPYLVGTDNHLEYYYFNKNYDHWLVNWPHPFNSSMIVALLAPWLSKTLDISGYWVFKVIMPLALGTAPVLLYFMFSKFLSRRMAFLSCFFFVSLTPYFLEVTSMIKMMVGELLLVATFLIIVNKYWNGWLRAGALTTLAVGLTVTHYTMAMVAAIYLGAGLIVMLILQRKIINLKFLLVPVLIIALMFGTYLSQVAGGTAFSCVVGLGKYFLRIPSGQHANPPNLEGDVWSGGYVPPEDIFSYNPSEDTIPNPGIGVPPRYSWRYTMRQQTPLTKMVLGLDFVQTTTAGKAFRIVTWISFLSIILGVLWAARNRKKIPIEFQAFGIIACCTMLACIFIPGFQSILNPTRWYHLATIFLAPCVLWGLGVIFKRYKYVAFAALMIPMFLFNTGFIYEISNDTITAVVEIPYSVTLSQHRVDLGTAFTTNDYNVIKYAFENNNRPILADFLGFSLLEERWGKEGYFGIFPADMSKLGNKTCYLFLREQNVRERKITYWSGIGTRVSYTWDEKKFTEVVGNSTVVYQLGDAKLLHYTGPEVVK